MDIDPKISLQNQHTLSLDRAEMDLLDELPMLWQLAEGLTAPDLEIRNSSLTDLIDIQAVRRYPLIAYLVATRITEPDIALRCRIVEVVADVLLSDDLQQISFGESQLRLADYLTQMRTRQVFSLLQVVAYESPLENKVGRLLGFCSYAGNHLSSILADRQAPLNVRRIAAVLIGRVGYVDALSTLERLALRIESRFGGRQMIMWEVSGEENEASLLPTLQNTIQILRAP